MDIVDSNTLQPVQVDSIAIDENYKLLGVQIAFDGNYKEQLKSLQEKTNHLINVFARVTLPAHSLQLGFNTIAIPTLYYPLPATAIPINHLNAIQHKLTKNLLPKLGLNRTFPRAITYAPSYFGGAGIKDIAVEQSVLHITSLIGHFRANTDLATNYTQLLESYMILSGIPESPLVNTRPVP